MFRPTKPPPDARIIKRREQEDRLSKIQNAVQADQALGAAASWEQKTTAKIDQLSTMRRYEALKARRTAELEQRREQLAAKLYAEEQALKEELVQSQETPAQRRAALAQRARELAAKREAERQALADALLEESFRENCDPLRERYTRHIIFKTQAERQQQVEEKLQMRMLEQEEARQEAELVDAERRQKEARYQEDVRKRQQGALDLQESLRSQVAARDARHAAEMEQEQAAIHRMQQHWAKLQAEAEAADAHERARLQQLAVEVKEFNRLKQLELSEADRVERELDLQILRDALEREAAEEAAEEAARTAKRQEVLRYRHQLASMMAKQAADQSQQDAMIEAANRENQAAEDAEWARRDAARRQLMAEVDAIRQQQIAAKRLAKQAAKEESMMERVHLEEAVSQEVARKEAAAAEARRKALMQQLDLQTQTVARAHLKAAEVEDKLHAAQLAKDSEARYMERVADAQQKVEPQQYFGRKKVEWFH